MTEMTELTNKGNVQIFKGKHERDGRQLKELNGTSRDKMYSI